MVIDSDVIYDTHEYGILLPSREIFLHRFIHTEAESTGDIGVEHRMAVMCVKNLRLLNNVSNDPITIHMQSRGGDWNDAMAVYDAIIASPARITIIAYAHARSMTSIILQAADRRIMMPNTDFVVHYGWLARGEDRATPVQSWIEHEKVLNERMLMIYAQRMKHASWWKGKQLSTIVAFIQERLKEKVDWILTAEEAVKYGFVDEIYGG